MQDATPDARFFRGDKHMQMVNMLCPLCWAVLLVVPTGLDLSVVRQRALLRAAVFGRAFCSDVPRDLLRSVALKLRLLNALREPDVGLPLTMPQLEALSLPVVVST